MKGARPMLDWQGKRWIKAIAVIVVVAFITYDIAWAMDFSPIAITSPSPTQSSSLFSKFGSFISKSILKKTDKREEAEETEISFRSQIIPTKKYGEGSGFQRLEAAKDAIKRQIEDVRKRHMIETERRKNLYRQYQMNKDLYMQEVEKVQEDQGLQQQIMKARSKTIEAAAKAGEFSYTLTKSGIKIKYKDGLPSSIESEKVYDNLGQVSIKNTKNMEYNEKKLLVSYDAEITDSLGNVTKIQWRDGVYSDDSFWYASDDTNVGKYLL